MRRVHRSSTHVVAGYVGTALVFIGALLLVPLATLPAFPEETRWAPCIIFPAVSTMAFGYLVYYFGAKNFSQMALSRVEAAGTMTLIWLFAIVAYAVPLAVAGILTVPQAIFESTSGLTTTGLSVTDVASCPKMFLMHRSMMHYVGGVGLILVLTCIVSDSHGLKMYSAEGHTEHLLSTTASSARTVLILYTGIIVIGALAYVIAGMPVFDAINISISAVSTGGFAVRTDSLASYASFPIELITIVLMLAGATNFLLNFMLLQGKGRSFLRHVETPVFAGIIACVSLGIAVMLFADGQAGSPLQALRLSLFQTVSVMTSTGLQVIPSLDVLAPGILYALVFLMIVGGEAGSTSGGIKVYRLVVYSKGLFWALREKFGHRRRVYSNKINRFGKLMECSRNEISSVQTFVGVYVGLFVICGFVFTLFGASVGDAVFEAASCLGNTGVSIGFIQGTSSPVVLVTASVIMLSGRLEIFPLIFAAKWMARGIREETQHVARR